MNYKTSFHEWCICLCKSANTRDGLAKSVWKEWDVNSNLCLCVFLLGVLHLFVSVRRWSGAAYTSMQPSFSLWMHKQMAPDKCNLSSLQIQYPQEWYIGLTISSGDENLFGLEDWNPLNTILWRFKKKKKKSDLEVDYPNGQLLICCWQLMVSKGKHSKKKEIFSFMVSIPSLEIFFF